MSQDSPSECSSADVTQSAVQRSGNDCSSSDATQSDAQMNGSECTDLQVPQPFHESHPATLEVWKDSTGTFYVTGADEADEWMFAENPVGVEQ